MSQPGTSSFAASIGIGLLLCASGCASGVSVAHAPSPSRDSDGRLAEASRLNSEAVALYRAGQVGQAVPLAERVAALVEQALGPEHAELASSLNNLAAFYRAQGQYPRAEPLYRRALAIRERALGPAHPDVAWSLHNLAAIHAEQGQHGQAEPLHQRALAIRERAFGPAHPDVAASLNDLAVLYLETRQFARGEPLARRALAVLERALGSQHLDVATSLFNLAQFYRAREQYAEAERLHQRVLALREKALGSQHPGVAETLSGLAQLYQAQGEHDRAEPLYLRALAIREKALGPQHPDVATSLSSLALLYTDRRAYAQAAPFYGRAWEIREKVLGPGHPMVAVSLNQLVRFYFAQGLFLQAEEPSRRALAILESTQGPEHPTTLISLENLAEIYEETAQYARAETIRRRVLAVRENALGPEHPEVALSLNRLGHIYRRHGLHAQAEAHFRRALAIQERALGPEHPDVAVSLTNLASLSWAQGRHAEAEQLYQRGLAVSEKALTPQHQSIVVSLNIAASLMNLAALYRDLSRYAEADRLYQRVLAILETTRGPEYLRGALLGNLAAQRRAQGQYAEAERLYQQGLAILARTLGASHRTTAEMMGHLATLHWAKGDLAEAIRLQTQADEIRERALGRALGAGAEERKRAYLATLARVESVTISLHVFGAPRDPGALRLALTTLLRRKGRALDAMAYTLGVVRRRLGPGQQALLDDWVAARTRYATLALQGPGSSPAGEYRDQLETLATRTERLETQIGEAVAEESGRANPVTLGSVPVTLVRVQEEIPEGAALVEIALFRPFDPRAPDQPSGAARYIAYVLARDGEPAWVDLGDAIAVDTEVTRLREALSDPQRGDVTVHARALDQRVMRPIRALLGERRLVLVSPDGALNLVPFAALVDEHDRPLIERYTFVYLTSGRDLLRPKGRHAARQEASLVVADPDFDDDRGLPGSAATAAGTSASSRRSVDLAGLTFPRLAGTADEARALTGLLPGATVLTRSAATESALKRVQSPRILHIATHGFFLADQAGERKTPRDVAPDAWIWESTETVQGENPLLRSGLALAGANRLRSGDEDGVLTALEATGLDLSGTKLVVLSACETGIGAVQRGEGVYGLRRALVLAGAESQVMSLWKVADEATADLMAAYYRRLFQGAGRAEGLRQAQIEIAANPRRGHPFFWASFILIGDWAPIDDRPSGR